MAKKLDIFDKILAELLKDSAFRKLVCPDSTATVDQKRVAAEEAIGTHRWKKLRNDAERDALIAVACTYTDATSMDTLDKELKKAGKSASYYFTDW
ncbi:MAG: hypothetical protein E3J86_12225 [Candidatus Thorarchaeota archaeon]|nr:MAG: hypothetical protein E3J86_12225 [Candidatus Thorarchaeota archaeon]